MLSYEAAIIRALGKLGTGDTKNPESKGNVGNHLGDYFLWKTVAKWAEARVEAIYKKMEDDGLVKVPDAPGSYELLNSDRFTLSAIVTQPVKRFDADALAVSLKKGKYKVPEPYTKEQVEAAKMPGKCTVRKTIKETA
jgi:hypothetical protein